MILSRGSISDSLYLSVQITDRWTNTNTHTHTHTDSHTDAAESRIYTHAGGYQPVWVIEMFITHTFGSVSVPLRRFSLPLRTALTEVNSPQREASTLNSS